MNEKKTTKQTISIMLSMLGIIVAGIWAFAMTSTKANINERDIVEMKVELKEKPSSQEMYDVKILQQEMRTDIKEILRRI